MYQPPHTRRVEIPVDSKMNMKIVLDNRQTSQHTRQNFQTRNEDLRKVMPLFKKSMDVTACFPALITIAHQATTVNI